MKSTSNARFVLSLGLVSFAAAGAALAAQPAADAQEQARVLLSGQNFSGDFKPRFEALSSTSATSIALDAQQQGREMILGRPAGRVPVAGVDSHRALGATAERKADALAMAREMILGSQSKVNTARTRLAGKAG